MRLGCPWSRTRSGSARPAGPPAVRPAPAGTTPRGPGDAGTPHGPGTGLWVRLPPVGHGAISCECRSASTTAAGHASGSLDCAARRASAAALPDPRPLADLADLRVMVRHVPVTATKWSHDRPPIWWCRMFPAASTVGGCGTPGLCRRRHSGRLPHSGRHADGPAGVARGIRGVVHCRHGVAAARLVDPSEQRLVLGRTHRHRYAKGETLFHEGDLAETIHLIHEGRVVSRRTTPQGDVVTLRGARPGRGVRRDGDARRRPPSVVDHRRHRAGRHAHLSGSTSSGGCATSTPEFRACWCGCSRSGSTACRRTSSTPSTCPRTVGSCALWSTSAASTRTAPGPVR